METPETRYSRSADGVHIAYQVLGDADLDIVLSPGFVSHLEHSWEDPSMARFFRRLASFARLIVFDKRGTGMSVDRTPDDRPGLLEDRVRDIATLMDTAWDRSKPQSWVCRKPARWLSVRCHTPGANNSSNRVRLVRRRGRQGPDLSVGTQSGTGGRLEYIEQHWGRGTMFLELFAPSLVGDKRYEDWFAKLERLSVSPGAAVALVRMLLEKDVTDILPVIRVPTLVLHKRDDKVVPVGEGRRIAELVPGAKFVEASQALTTGRGLATSCPSKRSRSSSQECVTTLEPVRALVTVMFVDIVDSTKRAAELGDRRWTRPPRELLRSRPP